MAKKGGFFLGAMVGAAVAGITALLYAPKSGKELREDLNQQSANAKGSAKEYADIAKEKGKEMKTVAKDASDDIKISLKESASQMKDQLTRASKDVGEGLTDLKQSATEVAQDAKSTVTEVAQEAKTTANETVENVKSTAKDTSEEMATSAKEGKKQTDDVSTSLKYDGTSLKEEVERNTMDYAYDQEKAAEGPDYPTANVSTEQTKESGKKDEHKTTNTNVGI